MENLYSFNGGADNIAPKTNENIGRLNRNIMGLDRSSNQQAIDSSQSATSNTIANPFDKANQAVAQFDKTGKLTPELKHQFTEAYKQSLKERSPALPQLMQELQQYGAQLHNEVTPQFLNQIGAIDHKVQLVASQYPPNEVYALSALYTKLAQAPNQEAVNQIQDEMIKMAPALKPLLEERAKVLEPLNATLYSKNSVVLQIEEQANAPALIAFQYGKVLAGSHDESEAKKYSIYALEQNRDPAIIQSLLQFAQSVGVSAKEINQIMAKKNGQIR